MVLHLFCVTTPVLGTPLSIPSLPRTLAAHPHFYHCLLPCTVRCNNIFLLEGTEKVTIKPGASKSHFSTISKKLSRSETYPLVLVGVPPMLPLFPGDALILWSSTPFIPLSCRDPTAEVSQHHWGPNTKVQEHYPKGLTAGVLHLFCSSEGTQKNAQKASLDTELDAVPQECLSKLCNQSCVLPPYPC